MISPDCKIKPASKPESGERICWNWNCERPLPKYARKWCSDHQNGDEYYVQHHIDYSRWTVIRSSRVVIEGDERYGLHECATCHSVTNNPEVDHIIPMGGDSRSGADCRHHVANLRVLCHDCHSEVSAVQARGRAAARRGNPQMELQL